WQLHVPRRVQEDALRVRDAAARLTHRLGRAPRVGELGDETGLDGEAISEALQARAVQATTSLDRPWGGQAEDGDATLAEQVGAADGGYGTVERKAMIEQLVRSLPRREREVLYLRFACDL